MLLEVISEVDVRESVHLTPEAVGASIIISDGLCLLEVLVSFLLGCFHLWVGRIAAD